MSWRLIAYQTWSNSNSPFIIKYDSVLSEYVVESIDGINQIPFSDIFNNPVFPVDLSNIDVTVKSLISSGVSSGQHIRSEGANTPSTPGHSFKNEISSGLYRESTGVLAISSLGNKVLTIDTIPSFLFKSWIAYNGATSTIGASGNVSSLVKNATGDYTVNFSTNMPDANYGIFTTAHQDASDTTFISFSVLSRTVSGYRIKYGHYDVGIYSPRDCDYVGSGVIR